MKTLNLKREVVSMYARPDRVMMGGDNPPNQSGNGTLIPTKIPQVPSPDPAPIFAPAEKKRANKLEHR